MRNTKIVSSKLNREKKVRDMTIKSQKCLVSNIECSHVNTCRQTLERCGVLDCEHAATKKRKIEAKYQKELQDRKELLKSLDVVKSGNNYNKKTDLTYKDAVIDKEAKGKREY